MPIATINPATGETLATFEPLTSQQIDARLQRAADAFRRYRRTSLEQRAEWLRSAADLLDAENAEIALIMTTEMGKTLASARAEATKCSTALRFYADHGAQFMADEEVVPQKVGATRAFVTHQPIGAVLAVMPWNFPLWQAMRFAAPALMAGNVGLLKHASNVPQSALWLESLFSRAGFPADVFQTLLISARQVEQVLRDPRVAAATLTGSGPAGQSVARIAGDVLKKTVLELGGSDPFVVMPSADVDSAVRVATTARCQNNGQTCVAAKRFIVHESIAEEFEEKFAASLSALVVGDPTTEGVDVGPLATEEGRSEVEELVADAVSHGARVLAGGRRPDRPGWFYPPTLLVDVTPAMRAFREELFGPVAILFRVPDLAAAIDLANDCDFGLGANIWTDDDDEQQEFIRDVEAGLVFVNGMVASHPDLPFGGVKASGYGRELTAMGMKEFMNVKSVWVGTPSA